MRNLTWKEREDLLVTALEGGSNHWYFLGNEWEVFYKKNEPIALCVFEALKKNVAITIFDVEYPDEEAIGTLSKVTLADREHKMREEQPEHYENIIDENWDAETADVWFQYVCLNELVYG